jgi:hypothetical protein
MTALRFICQPEENRDETFETVCSDHEGTQMGLSIHSHSDTLSAKINDKII